MNVHTTPTMTLLEVVDAGVRCDVTAFASIVALWRSRRYAETAKQCARLDMTCRLALARLEARYPGRVLSKLPYGEARAVELLLVAKYD